MHFLRIQMEKKQDLRERLDSIDEFEQQPVPKSHVKNFKSFVGMVAGEHIAGTEFVIGPLFVLHGASASDVIWGLLIGNILATLSWTLITAPIAVKTRLTIFYQLEKISGYSLVSIFNLMNGLLFCISASAMIGVSASAFGLLFDFSTPGLTDLYPTSIGFVIVVILVGSVIAIVGTFGFDKVSSFANIFAPWMPLVFLASGIAMLPQLGMTSIGEFWTIANEKIWTGTPVAGQTPYGFWHIMIFSWLCNSGMHIGLSDMSIYRYAKKARYGLASAFGMFIGHYMAWIASGILCAVALQSGNDNPSPGQIAFMAAGITGAITVVIAGWTTANPTIYRSGLALQALWPKLKRWKITMISGSVATLLACFPGIVSKLDQFLGIYALVAIPIGAIIFADVYLFPRFGLTQNLAEKMGIKFNLSVAISWLASILIGYGLYNISSADFFFFMALPGWVCGLILYILLALIQQKIIYKNTTKLESIQS